MQLNNLAEFAAACKCLSSDQIYEFFELVIENPLRDRILMLAPAHAAEPVRYALNLLGREYEVPSLAAY